MARDIFVYWRGKAPSQEIVKQVLLDYTKGLAVSVEPSAGEPRLYVKLPGQPSWPFQTVGPATDAQRAAWPELAREADGAPRPRFFEVYMDEAALDVITRSADPITDAIARDFAQRMATAFDGTLDD